MPELDESVIDDTKEVKSTVPPTLDQVHAMNQAKLEEEDENADDGKETTDEEEVDDKTGGDNTGADDVVEDSEVITEEAPVVKSASELDLDILKPGAGKVSIKDSEGKTFYFNSLDEVPDDFEPATYKELMRGVDALRDKRVADEKTAADAQIAEAKAEHLKQTEAMQKSWDKDADSLVQGGLLPKDATKLEKAKTEVYDYMEAELKKGNVITSFNQAYKSMMYDKQQIADTKKQKELDDAKKKRGGIVQAGTGGGETGSVSKNGSRVREAPRSGVSLDAVHNSVINSL